MKKAEVIAVKTIISKIIVALVVSAVGAGAYAVVRTYVNENTIEHMIEDIKEIKMTVREMRNYLLPKKP